jgi:hypothetical protein
LYSIANYLTIKQEKAHNIIYIGRFMVTGKGI